jgi:hypothetical protein
VCVDSNPEQFPSYPRVRMKCDKIVTDAWMQFEPSPYKQDIVSLSRTIPAWTSHYSAVLSPSRPRVRRHTLDLQHSRISKQTIPACPAKMKAPCRTVPACVELRFFACKLACGRQTIPACMGHTRAGQIDHCWLTSRPRVLVPGSRQ